MRGVGGRRWEEGGERVGVREGRGAHGERSDRSNHGCGGDGDGERRHDRRGRSDCPLPVRFDIARHWKAKSIDTEAELSKASKGSGADPTGALADSFLRQGPVTAVCEIDAKPAGDIGFLRVWTGRHGNADAGTVLRQFVAAEDHTSKATYRTVRRGGGLSGVEVEYLCTGKLLEETKKDTALAVSRPDGPVVLHLGGMDTEEHEAMRPAYEPAKQTLTSA